MNEVIETTQLQNRAERCFFFCGATQATNFLKSYISSAPEKAFPVFLAIVWLLNSLQKRCFSLQEFTRFLSTVSSQRQATHIDTSLIIVVIVAFMLRVLTYDLSYELFWI